jgi:hypothetical protein
MVIQTVAVPKLHFGLVMYPTSGLVSINGTLWRFMLGYNFKPDQRWDLTEGFKPETRHGDKFFAVLCFSLPEQLSLCYWRCLRPVGVAAVQTIQRLFRGPRRRQALAMALHQRLGAGSTLVSLGEDLLRVVVGHI